MWFSCPFIFEKTRTSKISHKNPPSSSLNLEDFYDLFIILGSRFHRSDNVLFVIDPEYFVQKFQDDISIFSQSLKLVHPPHTTHSWILHSWSFFFLWNI